MTLQSIAQNLGEALLACPPWDPQQEREAMERIVKKIEDIAKVCHEANRAYCETLSDHSMAAWSVASESQRDSIRRGVAFALKNPHVDGKGQHEAWLQDKLKHGWTYGAVKSAEVRTHPNMLPYSELPEKEKKKDLIFRAIVQALAY